MSSSIEAIRISSALSPIRAPKAPGDGAGAGEFQKALSDAIHQVEQFRHDANTKVDHFMAGEGEDLHSVALATQRAELTFELMLQTRNKVVQAYQEIMRMQV